MEWVTEVEISPETLTAEERPTGKMTPGAPGQICLNVCTYIGEVGEHPLLCSSLGPLCTVRELKRGAKPSSLHLYQL